MRRRTTISGLPRERVTLRHREDAPGITADNKSNFADTRIALRKGTSPFAFDPQASV